MQRNTFLTLRRDNGTHQFVGIDVLWRVCRPDGSRSEPSKE